MSPRQISFLASVCFLAAQSFWADQRCRAQEAPLLASMEHFRDTATVEDDPIAGVTTVNTEQGYVQHHGPLRAVWNDEYLTGTIDRKTGGRSFELIATLTYRGTRRVYSTAKFQGPEGPVQAPITTLKTTAVNCPTGECTYTDRVSFPLEESLLRSLAARAAAAKSEVWRYRLDAKPGGAYAGELSVNEIAGFLAKIDEYTGAAPPPLQRSAATPDLGIGGLHVEAGAQLPARRGVLVTAVSPGSIADRAGIIVGDIVREIDGHAIETPPDLLSAITAAAPKTSVIFKVFRGTTELTLTGQL